nr:EVE domain-containing protein [Candidatus Freyarchaeota archaeon]
MNYWLCLTNAENWEVVKNKKVWGVIDRYKNKISQVKPGDILIF